MIRFVRILARESRKLHALRNFTASQVTLQCCWLPVVAVSAAWNKPWSREALLLPGDATGLDGCEADYGMIQKNHETKLEGKDQNTQMVAFSSYKVQCICVFLWYMSICLSDKHRKSRLDLVGTGHNLWALLPRWMEWTGTCLKITLLRLRRHRFLKLPWMVEKTPFCIPFFVICIYFATNLNGFLILSLIFWGFTGKPSKRFSAVFWL